MNPPTSPGPMVYDATDKLVTWPGMQSFTYHPTGSLKEQKNTGGTVQKTWAYTGAELISSVTHAGVASPSSMAWDADSNRVSFTSSEGGTTEFVYDPSAGIPAVIEEVTPSGSVYYVREPGGALIARIDGATTNYYHFDALGSTRLLTDSSGNVTDEYSYDAWGNTTHTGNTEQPYQHVGQLGYYSHHQDSHLFNQNGYQFLQLGVRFYDALTGRFTQVDRIADVSDRYLYCDDLPLCQVDPTGYKGEWLDKARKCARSCAVKCAGNPFEPGQKCFDKCILECMGAAWGEEACAKVFCILFRRSRHCEGGNACTLAGRNPDDPTMCEDCCDLKHTCCLLVNAVRANAGGAIGCHKKWEACGAECNMKSAKKKGCP